MTEQQLLPSIILLTMFVFWFFYELTHPLVILNEERRWNSLLKKDQLTGRLKVKQFFFNKLFKRVILIDKMETRKGYFIKFNGRYYKLFITFKVQKNEAKILQIKPAKKGN